MLLIVTLKYVLSASRRPQGRGRHVRADGAGASVAKRAVPAPGAGVIGAPSSTGCGADAGHLVLSAVEGLKLVAPSRAHVFCSPSSSLGAVCVQSHGTAKVAQYFGPVMLIWFAALAAGGLVHIIDDRASSSP